LKRFSSFHPFDGAIDPLAFQHHPQEFGVVGIIFQMQNPQKRTHCLSAHTTLLNGFTPSVILSTLHPCKN